MTDRLTGPQRAAIRAFVSSRYLIWRHDAPRLEAALAAVVELDALPSDGATLAAAVRYCATCLGCLEALDRLECLEAAP